MGRYLSGVTAAIAVASGLALSGCATESYVNEQVGAVSARVDALDSKVTALSGHVDQVDKTAQAAGQRADSAYTLAEGHLVRTVVSESDTITFETAKWDLSDEAKATLTAFADKLKTDNKRVFIEIVGGADARGDIDKNRILGEKRALETRRFLSSQGIPLHNMSTVSWGEEHATGTTEEELAAARKVTLRVLN
jgi:outer membrane protein OmpA-like peptidoglycan-associated protein